MNVIGEYLRFLRNKNNLSMEKVQKLTNITNSRLSKMENGIIADPPAKDLLTLSKVYGIDVLELFLKAGYLTQNNSCPNHIFQNTENLTSEEIEYVQYTINFILTNREEGKNDL